MGRYTQRRRAASGPSPAAAPPPAPVAIASVTVTATDTVRILFDGDPLVNSSIADGSFLVNGGGFGTVNDLGANTVELVQPFGQPPITAGDPWDLTSQPSWASATVTNPASGTTV